MQYRVLYDRLYARDKLVKINIKKDALCLKCESNESIKHLIYKCESSEKLWHKIEKWMNNIGFINYQIDNRKTFLEDHKKKHFIINHILLTTKQCIYENKYAVNPCNTLHVKRIFRNT